MDDKLGGEDILPLEEMGRWVLDAVELWRVGPGLGHHVEPALLPEVPRFLPLIGRRANRPGAGVGLDLNVADVASRRRRLGDFSEGEVVFDEAFVHKSSFSEFFRVYNVRLVRFLSILDRLDRSIF